MRQTKDIAWIFCLLVTVNLLLFGCTKDSGPVRVLPDLPPPVPTSDTISFVNDVQPLIQVKCWVCHPASGELDLGIDSAYNQLVNIEAVGWAPAIRVVPFDTSASVLYHKIKRNDVYGLAMPPGVLTLTEQEQSIFTKWILQGAQNN